MSTDPNLYRSWGFTPEQARDRLVALNANPGDQEAWLNKMHPLHQAAVEHRLMLQQIIAGERAPAGSTPQPRPAAGATPQARIFNAQNHPGYLDRWHPQHQVVLAELETAYRDLKAKASESPR